MTPLAIAAGLLIADIDSRPAWDDTGITAGMIFFGALGRRLVAPPGTK
jgi:hypothetical protein